MIIIFLISNNSNVTKVCKWNKTKRTLWKHKNRDTDSFSGVGRDNDFWGKLNLSSRRRTIGTQKVL